MYELKIKKNGQVLASAKVDNIEEVVYFLPILIAVLRKDQNFSLWDCEIVFPRIP